ncbi:MAG: hypothetical protein HQK83_12540 [Fibrobacteria bacterium]|nr:hypothetical protein [Fibrobacteria bacterium]
MVSNLKQVLFKPIFLVLVFSLSCFSLENQLNPLFLELVKGMSLEGTPTLAILPFSAPAQGDDAQAGQMVSEYAVAFFASQNQFQLVDRADFHRVLEELEFSQSDLADNEKTLELGKTLVAAYLVTGSITEALGKKMISAKIIKTETGEIVNSQTVTVNSQALTDFYKDALGEKASASSAIYRSLAVPGWGQFYTGHSVHGIVFSSLTAVSLGVLVYGIFDFVDKDERVANSIGKELVDGSSSQSDSIRAIYMQERDDAQVFVYSMIGVTAGIWVVNVIDAAIFGKKESNRVKKLYFSMNHDLRNSGWNAQLAYRF